MRTNELMLYKNMDYGEILKDMTFLMENHGNDYYNRDTTITLKIQSLRCRDGSPIPICSIFANYLDRR